MPTGHRPKVTCQKEFVLFSDDQTLMVVGLFCSPTARLFDPHQTNVIRYVKPLGTKLYPR